jgi:hypothetical protein
MAGKNEMVDMAQFQHEPDKAKALGQYIDQKNAKVRSDQTKTFHNDLEGIGKYTYRRITKKPKYIFFGR